VCVCIYLYAPHAHATTTAATAAAAAAAAAGPSRRARDGLLLLRVRNGVSSYRTGAAAIVPSGNRLVAQQSETATRTRPHSTQAWHVERTTTVHIVFGMFDFTVYNCIFTIGPNNKNMKNPVQ